MDERLKRLMEILDEQMECPHYPLGEISISIDADGICAISEFGVGEYYVIPATMDNSEVWEELEGDAE